MLCGFLIGTIYKYPNNTVEVTFPDDNYVIKTYNAIGDVIKIKEKDNSAIEYKYHCSGQLKQVLMDNNNAKVTIEYDALGRRTALIDPNAGTTSYNLYNAFGDVIQQTDDRSIVTVNTYDNLRRLKTQSMTNEPTKTYNYYPSGNGKGQLQSITSSKSELNYDYGDFGRLTKMTEKIVGDQSFVTQYEYDQYGNKTGITYPGGFKVKRNYDTIGYVTDIRQASNNQLIWQRLTENALGQPLTYKMGNGKTTTCLYDGYNLPKRVSAPGIQDFEYNINPENGNMNWRRDNLKSFPNQEIFDYDITSRLKGVDHGNQNVMSMQYYPNGNIRSKQDAGSGYQYQIYPKFHALSSITEPTNVLINSGHQEVEYNGFNKATTIYNNQSQRLVIDYGVDNQRMRTRFYKGHIFLDKTKYFAANYEKEVTSSTTREINYISTPYGVLAAYIKENNNTGQMYYLYKDHLGSITHITNASGEVKETRSFDAWGRMRNPKNWSYTGVDPMSILDRGYTGHEHLFGFDLINMNGRLYDPLVGLMLSPDPYVSMPESMQGYNRYNYALNNPLKYTDPTGEWVHLVVGAVIGAINGAIMAARSDAKGWEWVGYIGIGAAAGALSAGVANGASVALAGAGGTFGMGFVGNAYSIAQFGFMQGAVIGAAAGFTAGFIGGAGYSWMGGANFGQGLENGLKAGGWGALSGAVVGGLTTGISASLNGRRFWDGDYTLQQKLDIMMAQYKPELLESIGEADAEVLVGNNKNLKQHGAFNRKGDIVVNKDGQEVIVHGVARQGTINREELPFGYGYNNNKIALSKNTVRNLWNGDMDAKGTLFHEWCHARDYHTGVFRYLSKNYPNQWKSLMEVRAYQFNPNSSWAQYYHRLVYPLQILKGR